MFFWILKDIPKTLLCLTSAVAIHINTVFSFIGSRAILSGPAGGVVGVSLTAYNDECREEQSQGAPPPVIGFDMGGTSTDVSRYAGAFTHVVESVTAGVTIQAPQVF